MQKLFLLALFVLTLGNTFAQESAHEEKNFRHVIALTTGNSYIPKANTSEESIVVSPSYGLDYVYLLADNWAIGSMNDMELLSYVIEKPDGNTVARERVFISTINVYYTALEHYSIYLGAGMEFEKHENFSVFRLGADRGFELKNDWEVTIGAAYDFKEAYDSYTFMIGFAKFFGERKN